MPAPFYPSKPAAPSPVHPSLALFKYLLRIVLGDNRKGGPTIALRDTLVAKSNEKLELRLSGSQGECYQVDLGACKDNRPDYWFDFVADNIDDLQLSVEICKKEATGEAGNGKEKGEAGRVVVIGGEWVDMRGVLKRALVNESGKVLGVIILDYLVVAPFDWSRLGEVAQVLREVRSKQGLLLEQIGQNGSSSSLLKAGESVSENGKEQMDVQQQNQGRVDSNNKPIFAGHRGVGTSRSTFVQENTLLSFVMATRGPLVKHVELDVQLTKDNHPVVYHDYFVGKDENGRGGRPIYAITLQEWQDMVKESKMEDDLGYDSDHGGKTKLQRRPARNNKNSHKKHEVSKEVLENKPLKDKLKALTKILNLADMDGLKGRLRDELPTLKRICRKVPKDVGLLVEVKYPPAEVAIDETIPYPERNLLVDETLYRIFKEEQNSGRSVMFLTFDPDLAAMLKLKQKVYPVYYLNSESREEDTDTLDPRCTGIDGALSFAASQQFDGLVLLADMVLEDESLVKRSREVGLKLMTYGQINMSYSKTCRQIELGVDGIIADNIAGVAKEYCKSRSSGTLTPGADRCETFDSSLSESVYSLINSSDDGYNEEDD